jgi:LAS superfamily LD-carboxypeptidase LdcB
MELDEEFAATVAYRWLEEHAPGFGFTLTYPRGNPHGIGYEPWHWCWSEAGADRLKPQRRLLSRRPGSERSRNASRSTRST